jgi:hypothetical protein
MGLCKTADKQTDNSSDERTANQSIAMFSFNYHDATG